jgi:shikimate dehydrogenase
MKVLGVVGWPIAHSKSPAMQNAALRHLHLDYVYLPFAVQDLPTAIAGARALGFRGLNVTIPHKEAALSLCEPDALAKSVGAVNTLIFDNDAIRGTNTDVYGFRKLMEESGISPRKTVILGAGGAARAVLAALPDAIVVARNPRGLKVEPWDSLAQHLPDADLLVDCTPRGLTNEKESLDLTNTKAAVLDLVVRRETALTREAKRLGLSAATGTAMLLHQGAAALEHWIGQPAPVEIMRKALDAALD